MATGSGIHCSSYTFSWSSILILTSLVIHCCTNPGKGSEDKQSANPVAKTNHADHKANIPGNTEQDSLYDLLNSASHDTMRIRILDAMAYAESDDSIIDTYNQKIENLVQKNLDSSTTPAVQRVCLYYQARAVHRKGLIHSHMGEYEKALKYYNTSIGIKEKINDIAGVAVSLNNIGNVYSNQGDFIKAIEYHEKSLRLKEDLGDSLGISMSLNNLGNIYAYQGNYPEALGYYDKSLKIMERLGKKSILSKNLNNIANIYIYQGDVAKALDYYNRSIKINEEIGDQRNNSDCLNNIGLIYKGQGDTEKAMEYFLRSLKLREDFGDKKGISGSYNNIGNVYLDLAEERTIKGIPGRDSLLNKALEYYNKSLKLSEETNDIDGIATALSNIGLIYDNKNSFNEALSFYNRALEYREHMGDKSGISIILNSIGIIYFNKNQTDLSYQYARRSYSLAKETGNVLDIAESARLLEKIYARQGNYKLSRQYFGEYVVMRDSLKKEENQRLTQQKYYQYEYEKKAATDSIAHSKEMEISKLEIARRTAESRKQKLVIVFITIGLLLVLLFAGIILRSLQLVRKQKNIIMVQKRLVDETNIKLNQQNEEIKTQRDEIENQRDEIIAQRDMVFEQKTHIEQIHHELTGSIRYAERIQNAVLPSEEYIREVIGNCGISASELFILYKPRDIVSGDFYLFNRLNNTLVVAVADCTGHGVPGALMSMLGISFLNEILTNSEEQSPGLILNELRNNIIHSLQQKGIQGEQKDGMDIALISYNVAARTLQYAGANSPLIIISGKKHELTEIKPDRMPVAIHENMKPFTNHVVPVNKGDIIYLATDGYGDQFGGPEQRKFLSRRFKELLLEISGKSMSHQKAILDETIEDWKNNYVEKYQQTDDITVMGLKLV